MAGIKRLIYVKSKKLMDEIEKSAGEIDRSVSWYLVDCHRRVKSGIVSVPEVSELMVKKPGVKTKPVPEVKVPPVEESVEENPVVRSDTEMTAADRIRMKMQAKAETISNVRENTDRITSPTFGGGITKWKQTGKKEKK